MGPLLFLRLDLNNKREFLTWTSQPLTMRRAQMTPLHGWVTAANADGIVNSHAFPAWKININWPLSHWQVVANVFGGDICESEPERLTTEKLTSCSSAEEKKQKNKASWLVSGTGLLTASKEEKCYANKRTQSVVIICPAKRWILAIQTHF